MKEKIRVLLVDDHVLVRDSLARTLSSESDLLVVGECGTVEEAVKLTRSASPTVVLLDYDLGGIRGTSFLELTQDLPAQPRVLVVTAWVTEAEVRRLVALGAAGVIRKENRLEDLVEAVRAVAAGGSWFDQRLIQAFLRPEPRTAAHLHSTDLNSRERTVLRCLLEGMSNKEIGAQMSVSEAMVKALLQRLFEKTGVHTRGQLVRLALENQWT